MFVVMLRHTMEDLPIFVSVSKPEAIEHAESAGWFPTEAIAEVLRTDCSTPVAIHVIEFKNGVPVKVIFRRSREDEDDDDETTEPPTPSPVEPETSLVPC